MSFPRVKFLRYVRYEHNTAIYGKSRDDNIRHFSTIDYMQPISRGLTVESKCGTCGVS